jgi:hypothetical protein
MHEAIHKLSTFTAVVCEVRDDLKATLPGLLMLIENIEAEHSADKIAMGIRGCMVPLAKLLSECTDKLQASANPLRQAPQGVSMREALDMAENLTNAVNGVAQNLRATVHCYRHLIQLIERKHAHNSAAVNTIGGMVPLCALLTTCVTRLQDAAAKAPGHQQPQGDRP